MTLYYVENEIAFEDQMRRAKDLFHLDQRLPNGVFQSGYRACYAVEFDQLITYRFWEVIRAISTATGDHTITWTVLEPHPSEYYKRHFGYFGVVQFPLSSDAETCMEVLAYEPPGSPADAMLYNSRVVGCYPDSGRWLVWGERTLGIAIIAIRDDPEEQSMAKHLRRLAWVPLDEATELIAINFIDKKLPSGFASTFRANYVARD